MRELAAALRSGRPPAALPPLRDTQEQLRTALRALLDDAGRDTGDPAVEAAALDAAVLDVEVDQLVDSLLVIEQELRGPARPDGAAQPRAARAGSPGQAAGGRSSGTVRLSRSWPATRRLTSADASTPTAARTKTDVVPVRAATSPKHDRAEADEHVVEGDQGAERRAPLRGGHPSGDQRRERREGQAVADPDDGGRDPGGHGVVGRGDDQQPRQPWPPARTAGSAASRTGPRAARRPAARGSTATEKAGQRHRPSASAVVDR